MAGPGLVPPPPQGVVPPAGPAPGFEFPLRPNWKPKDLANIRFMNILEAKWLPEYGPDVTTKLLETYTPATIKQYSSHWSSFTDWIVRTNQSVSSSALILKYLDYLFTTKELSVVTLK